MILQLFSVYDKKGGTYGQPFALPTRGVAMRTFTSWVGDPNSFFAKFPSDFELYQVGEFDQTSGEVRSLVKPDYVGRADDLKNVASAS